MPNEQAPQESKRSDQTPNRTLLYIIAGLVALVAILAIGLISTFGRGVTQAQVKDIPKAPPVTQHTVTPPPLAPPVTEMPQVEVKPGEPAKQPPADVVRYLQHLKNVETYRTSMANDFNQAAELRKGIEKSYDPDSEDFLTTNPLQRSYSKYAQSWQNLIRYFEALPPPEPCRQLAVDYGDALRSYVQVMNGIQLGLYNGDINSLVKVLEVSRDVPDKLEKADDEMKKVCDDAGIKRDFSIAGDVSLTGLGGLKGLPGIPGL